jgi:hypothetical protein
MAKTRSEVDEAQQKVTDAWHDTLHNAYAPVLDEADPAKQATMVQTIGDGLRKAYPNKPATDFPQYTDAQSFKLLMAGSTTNQWITAHAAQLRGQAQQTQAQASASKEARSADEQSFQNSISALAAGPPANAQEYQQRVSQLPYSQANRIFSAVPPEQYDPQKSVGVIRQLGMNPDQQAQNAQAAANAAQNALPKTEPELSLIVNDPSKPQPLRDAAKGALQTMVQQHNAERPITLMSGASALAPDDYRRAGEEYARTGIIPGVAMRDAQARALIVHEGNEWARNNNLSPADVVTMQAAYKGDARSLANLQKNRDQVVSFESTAGKNLDLFLAQAQKVVDSGSQWINTPLRSIARGGLGSADQAAYDAARQVATNEIAKVTSGGGMAAALSDAARKEVGDFNPMNATLAQTMAVANVLRQDMANRHQSLDGTLSDIRARIGGLPEPNPPSSPGGGGQGGGQGGARPPSSWLRTALGAGGHTIGQRADGGWYDVQTGAKVQ